MPKIRMTSNFFVPRMTTPPVLLNVDQFPITKDVRGESLPEGKPYTSKQISRAVLIEMKNLLYFIKWTEF